MIPGEYEPQTRDQRQVEVEDILQPFYGRGGLVCQDLNEVWTGQISGRLQGILVEGLDAVLDAQVGLGASKGTVDTGRGLGGVATEESCVVSLRSVGPWR